MQYLDPSVLAAPIYILFMLIEHYALNKKYYLPDTIASISTGLISLLTVGIMSLGVVALGDLFYQYRLFTITHWSKWIIAMIAWDFSYYWLHRYEHTVSIFWATHVSHHSSQHYNFSTALRQPWFPWLSFFIFPPLTLLGIESQVFMFCGGINLIYQFFLHTEVVNKLPNWFEYIFNTPSHHRVHHGSNHQYLDKNHGGILIIWDRLFNTFEEEKEQVVYGITKNINSYNLWTIFSHEYKDIFHNLKQARSWKEIYNIIFGKPGWKADRY